MILLNIQESEYYNHWISSVFKIVHCIEKKQKFKKMNSLDKKFKPIIKPMNIPSQSEILSQSIIKSFINQKNSSVHVKKQNNNALPEIHTDLLTSFNPQAFQAKRQDKLKYTEPSQRSSFISPRFQSLDKIKVNFSYNNNYQQNFNSNPRPFTQHFPQINRSTSNNVIRPSSSLQSERKYSNLSAMSQSKKPLISTMNSNHLNSFQKNSTEMNKTHKLGQKLKKFDNQRYMNSQQRRLAQQNIKSAKKESENTSFQVFQSPRRNISSISMQRSEYIFLTDKKQQGKITIEPETYVFSHSNLTPKPKYEEKNQNFYMNRQQISLNPKENDNTSMILPIEEQQMEEIQIAPVLNQNKSKSQNDQMIKSPGKIDNSVYLQDQKPISLPSITLLKRLQTNNSGLSEDEQMNKISKISKRQSIKNNSTLSAVKQKQPQFVSPFQKISQQVEIQKRQKQFSEQRNQLLERISKLQLTVRQKQEENNILKSKLQNVSFEKHLEQEYQKLEILSKLSEVQVKKLRNEIKMFQIKQKIYQNKQKEHIDTVNTLKSQIKTLKNSNSLGNIDLKDRIWL